MSPFVSIIVPVYNVEKHIRRCLNSLLNQTYSNFEVLLINDGSTDSSGQICDEYQAESEKFRVFHIKNGGVSNARNFGIENCKGEFIQFVDSDDYVNETYISGMVNQIIDKNVDLVISGIKQMLLKNENLTLIKEIVSIYDGNYNKAELKTIMGDLIESSYINYCYSKLISKKVLLENNIRFDKNLSLGEDTLFVLDVIKYSKNIYISSKVDYNYLIHSSDTLTYKLRPDKFHILNKLSSSILNFCVEEDYFTDDVKEILDKRYFEIIKFCLDENFKPSNYYNLWDRLNNIKVILENKEVCNFISKDISLFKSYPKSLIKAIKSKNSLRYFFTYYLNIVSSKFKEIL
ncbi:glycosyltransferase family 2 protein [Mesobacillus foraminis]|uniref:glycosyltransferase family 2 protein n=1 Tax=Mesobacillus foraminis TaxID=279826 RepID=UPI000EF45B76|nr:glycosyltransferase family 2 protein [Mesobacillus foraminis]